MPHTLKDVLPLSARLRSNGHLEIGGGSEEGRVGEKGRSWGGPDHLKKKKNYHVDRIDDCNYYTVNNYSRIDILNLKTGINCLDSFMVRVLLTKMNLSRFIGMYHLIDR